MLHGTELFIYTDHKDLTFATLYCRHILCWRLYVEAYGPIILYHPGKKKVIVDLFLLLWHCDVLLVSVGENAPLVLLDFTSKFLNISNDPDLLECFLNLPLPDVEEKNSVNLKWIHTQQNIGTGLDTKAAKYVPGNTKILYSPEQLLSTIQLLFVRQTINRQYKGVKTLGDVLALGVLSAL